MDITLSRHSVVPHNVSSLHPSTFALLKLSKGKPQKAVYGTDDGCLTCFSIKKNQVVVAFRTPPGHSPVSCVHAHVTSDGKDRIFFAVGSVVTGVSKKGKIFKTIDCATSSFIASIHFSANRLFVADQRACKCFVDWREAWSVPLKDQITAFTTGPLSSPSDSAYIIASRDNALRIIRDGRVDVTLELPGSACCLCLLDCRQGDALLGMQDDSGGKDIAYALHNGEVQCVMVEGCSTIPLWTLPPCPGAAVTSMCFHNRAPAAAAGGAPFSPAPNLVLGRSNGSFEVYDCSEGGAPRRIFHKELGQTLHCLQVGRMWGTSDDEYIFATFSGSISCFSTAPRTESDFSEAMGVSAAAPVKSSAASALAAAPVAPHPQPGIKLPVTNAASLSTAASKDADATATSAPPRNALPKKPSPPPAPTTASSSFFSAIGEKLGLGGGSGRGEAPATAAEALRLQQEERAQSISAMHAEVAKLQKAVQSKKQELAKLSVSEISASSRMKVRHELVLLPAKACLSLSVEADVYIDYIAIRSSQAFVVVDAGDCVSSITSTPDPLDDSASLFLCTFRSQTDQNQRRLCVELRAKVFDGRLCDLLVFVAPKLPPLTAVSITIPVRPLALLARAHKAAVIPSSLPVNVLSITGDFGISAVHAWVGRLLPDMPLTPSPDANDAFFISSIDNSILSLTYGGGSLKAVSDSILTLSVIKDAIASCASESGDVVSFSFNLHPQAADRFVDLIHEKKASMQQLQERVRVLDALKEIKNDDPDVAFLPQFYRDTLDQAEALLTEGKLLEVRLEALHEHVKQFHSAHCKVRGRVVGEEQLQQLVYALQHYSREELLRALRDS